MEERRDWRLLWSVLVVVDVGFIAYWAITLLHLIPEEYLFHGYEEPVLVAWNWSFLPLDILMSLTGLMSLWQFRRGQKGWARWTLLSLALSFASGLQAIAFWALRRDFELQWWLPNLFLMAYPLMFLRPVLRETERVGSH